MGDPYIEAVTKGFSLMGILVFLLVLTLVVAIHEYGHYLACRSVGIKVEKFAIGFGKPLLVRTSKFGTEWSLRPWLLGGFIEPNKIQMAEARPLAKAYIAIAGPAANILPFVALAAFFGKTMMTLKLLGVIYMAGLMGFANMVTLPFRWLFGIPGVGEAAATTASGGGDLVGPIGIGHMATMATAQIGAGQTFVILFVLLSLGLGLINLVPLPPLDGGRVVLAGVESVVGKKRIKPFETGAAIFGAACMLIILIVITTQDVGRLF